jgi:thiamine pyrophosphokinase
MQATIFAGGELVDHERAMQALQQSELVLAADGGERHCRALGVTPAAVIGDLDSLTSQQIEQLGAAGAKLVRHPSDKDQTDLELALGYAMQRGADRVVLLGAAGGRLDMTIANLLLLVDPKFRPLRIELWYGSQTAWLLNPPGGELPGQVGDTISAIPVGGDVLQVTTSDLEYPLRGETLTLGPARGVSNRVNGPMPRLTMKRGQLLVVHTPGKA